MLSSIPSGPKNFISNNGFLVWIICALLMVFWLLSLFKHCMEFAEAPYQTVNQTKVVERVLRKS